MCKKDCSYCKCICLGENRILVTVQVSRNCCHLKAHEKVIGSNVHDLVIGKERNDILMKALYLCGRMNRETSWWWSWALDSCITLFQKGRPFIIKRYLWEANYAMQTHLDFFSFGWHGITVGKTFTLLQDMANNSSIIPCLLIRIWLNSPTSQWEKLQVGRWEGLEEQECTWKPCISIG